MRKAFLGAALALGLAGGCNTSENHTESKIQAEQYNTCLRSNWHDYQLGFANGRLFALKTSFSENCVPTFDDKETRCNSMTLRLASAYFHRAEAYGLLNREDEALENLIRADNTLSAENRRHSVMSYGRFWEKPIFKKLEGITNYGNLVEKYKKIEMDKK